MLSIISKIIVQIQLQIQNFKKYQPKVLLEMMSISHRGYFIFRACTNDHRPPDASGGISFSWGVLLSLLACGSVWLFLGYVRLSELGSTSVHMYV